MRYLQRPFLFLLMLLCTPMQAAETIQYLGKSRFTVSGSIITENCEWQVDGQAILFLSFSRSSSLAAMRLKLKNTVKRRLTEQNCEDEQRTESYTFPLDVANNQGVRTFSATNKDQTQSIIGESKDLKIRGKYQFETTTDKVRAKWQGDFAADMKVVPGELVDLSEIKGSVLSTLPIGLSDKTTTIADATTLITDTDSSATLSERYGSTISMKQKSILNRMPVQTINNREKRRYMLLRGKIDTKVSLQDRDLDILTPNATIRPRLITLPTLRSTDNLAVAGSTTESFDTEFSVQYSQDGLNGTTTISVSSGSVEVTTIDNQSDTIDAGETRAYTQTLPRTSWVQPTDGGVLYEGVDNLFVWMSYPGAQAYIVEYNFPSPEFSDDYTQYPEFEQQVITVTADMYSIVEDLVVLNVPLEDSGLEGLKMESRIYALDEQGQIISDSVSSDRVKIIFQ